MTVVETPSRIIPLAYDIGEVVYHRLADERCRGLVTGILVRPTGQSYFVTWPDQGESAHYAFELSLEYVPDYEASA
jgi:hypothetical protein